MGCYRKCSRGDYLAQRKKDTTPEFRSRLYVALQVRNTDKDGDEAAWQRLSEATIVDIRDHAELIMAGHGRQIIEQGEDGDPRLYFIMSGTVHVRFGKVDGPKGQMPIFSRSFFGWAAVLSEGKPCMRGGSVYAQGTAELASIRVQDLKKKTRDELWLIADRHSRRMVRDDERIEQRSRAS